MMDTTMRCGLLVYPDPVYPPHPVVRPDTERAVPLAGVRIAARLAGLSTEVTVTQRYRNTEKVPVEAVYVFPLEEGAAVCGFAARIGDKLVQGRVVERDEAFEIYDDAMAEGHGAFLLDQERPNVFTASVGNLRPDETVEIRITYVALARFEGDAVRLTIPTTVSPRYVPADRPPEVGEPDGDRVNPEHRPAVPYGLTLEVEIDGPGPLRGLDSPSHAVRTRLREDGGARVELSHPDAALDRDFVLLVETVEPHRPVARTAVETDGTRVCQVTFLPRFDDEPSGGSEVLFLLDCSGSMGGSSIEQARRALALSIRALDEGDTFNVVRFGSRYEALWESPHTFGERSLKEATKYVDGIRADLGGTEIMKPLRALLDGSVEAQRPRQILLLTDGQVSNEKALVQLAGARASTCRIFTFGIGAGASEYLVRELARVTRGAAELIFPGERIEPKVLRMFGRVRSPALLDVRVDWGGLVVEQAPAETPPVFAGECLTVFGRVGSGVTERITLHAGDHSWPMDVDLGQADEGGPIPTLWARHAIRDLETGKAGRRGSHQRPAKAEKRKKTRLVELGQRYGLVSSATSYVAVEERAADEKVDGAAELRKVPVALTTGWGGRQSVDRQAGPPAKAFPIQADLRLAAAGPIMAAGRAAPRMRRRSVLEAAKNLVGHVPVVNAAPALEESRGFVSSFGPPGPAAVDRLYDLLMTQRADGSFPFSPVLEIWLGEARRAARLAAQASGETQVATALAVALLERDESAREDEWRPAARKARAWLKRHKSAFDALAVLSPTAAA